MKKIDEKKIQQQCWLWVEKTHKDLIMHSVVNGIGITIPTSIPAVYHSAIRKMIAMAVDIQKMTGMKNGISDTMIHGMNGKVIWCEFKTATGTQRDDQIRMQKKVESNGGVYIMPRSLEQFVQEIDKHYKWLTS